MNKKPRVAIVYDWFDKWGGVERMIIQLAKIFPHADFFSSYCDIEKAKWVRGLNIKTSFIQKLTDFIKKNRVLSVPFYPYAFESFDFSEYDLVISISSSFAKSIITKPTTTHISIALSPTRFLWIEKNKYLNTLIRKILFFYIESLKKWDLIISNRPDYYISISSLIKNKINKIYNKDSTVIHPPFDFNYWKNICSKKISTLPNDYFLIVSRLEPYKSIDIAIKTFNKNKKNLVIVGSGSKAKYLKEISNSNVYFYENITDSELSYCYSNAKALIMPQEEDFGYTALESIFFKTPVISYKNSGTQDIIIENKTGIFFDKQDEKSLNEAIEKYDSMSYTIKCFLKKNNNLEKFSFEKFETKIKNFIKNINTI